MRRIEATIEDIEKQEPSDDYVFVTLLNESPVLFPMEKVRAVYPNAMHVERRVPSAVRMDGQDEEERVNRKQSDQVALFAAFYQEVNGGAIQEDKLALFREVHVNVLREEGEPG
jgi:exonuclease SbcD